MKTDEQKSELNIEYKCGKLSQMVTSLLRTFLKKVNEIGLKETIQKMLPDSDIDSFVVGKLRNQLQKRRMIKLKKGLGRVYIQYRRNGIQVEPSGLLRTFIKRITITDEKIIRSLNDIISQIENKYIKDDNYIVSKVDDIMYELSQTGIYKPSTPEEKNLYDLIMLILANYYGLLSNDDVPSWILPALKEIQKGEFLESWLEVFAQYITEVITQMSENIFFDFKVTFDSAIVRGFLNHKTNKGQLSGLIDMMGIDVGSIIYEFSKNYVSPSFIRGASDIICDIACGFFSNLNSLSKDLPEPEKSIVPDGILDLTVTLGSNANNSRAFRWYSTASKPYKLEYSYDKDFEKSCFTEVFCEEVPKTFPNINLGLISSYKVRNLFKYSAVVENLEPGDIYYRICCSDEISETFNFSIKSKSSKTKVLVFADSQGMVKADYDTFSDVFEKAIESNPDMDFAVHLGDFVDDGNNEEYWQWVLSSRKWSENPVLPLAGNHEARQNSVAHDAGVENSIFSHFNIQNAPKNQNFAKGVYYSADYNNITCIVLNTNDITPDGLSEKQYNWAIQTALKSKSRWKILLTHKSPYSNGPHHKDFDVKLISHQIENIAYYGGIDLVLGGHDHVYARTPFLAQNCLCNQRKKIKNVFGGKTEFIYSPVGSVYVVPGTSGVKNYKQHLPAGFPAEKFLNLDGPVYSCIEADNQNLLFNSYLFNIENRSFKKVDSFCISDSLEKNSPKHTKLTNFISSIPDIPWEDHSRDINLAKEEYSKLCYSEKVKVFNYAELLRLENINKNRDFIIKNKIQNVKSRRGFLEAILDDSVGTITTDCDEINFKNKRGFERKIYINRPICIRGNAKLVGVRFILKEKSYLILRDSVCIDNSRKPFWLYPSVDIFTMHSDSTLIISDNATLNNGYAIGSRHGYGIRIKGENAFVYLNSSGHNFTQKSFVYNPFPSSKVKITSGKYISQDNAYTFDVNGEINISGGFVCSLRIMPQGKLVMFGGTVGDAKHKMCIPAMDCSGRIDLIYGTVNSHSGVSILIRQGGELNIDKSQREKLDVKGKILYNNR